MANIMRKANTEIKAQIKNAANVKKKKKNNADKMREKN